MASAGTDISGPAARAGPFRSFRGQSLRTIQATSRQLFRLVVAGALPERHLAVPAKLAEKATVLGISNARVFADGQLEGLVQEALRAVERERALRTDGAAPGAPLPQANFLAISGGSDNGAFGAGLLVGWTEAGTRPQFKLVTSVSTGALIAPMAFLGSDYDKELRAVYTNISPSDIFKRRSILNAMFNDAMSDTTPLYHLILRHVNEAMFAAIAREYAKGRLLLIGTTNLDQKRPVIWNIGALAASGKPGALELFHKILLASAAVPAMFPPVFVDVEAEGQRFQEMHVDGGAVAQMFLYPSSIGFRFEFQKGELVRERRAFLIRNSRMDAEWASVDRRLLSIVGQTVSVMIHYSGCNDALRIYSMTQHDGVDYNLAYIGSDFTVEHNVPFDRDYMRALFDYGYRRARAGYPWSKAPPAITQSSADVPDAAIVPT